MGTHNSLWFHDVGAGGGCWSEWGSCWGWSSNASCSGGTSSHRQTWAGPEELSGALMSRADVWILQWMADTVSAQTQPRNLWWGLCHTPHIFNLCPLCDLRPPFSFVCTTSPVLGNEAGRGSGEAGWRRRAHSGPGPLPFFPAGVTSPGLPSTLISLSSDSLCQYPFMTALPAGALHPLSLLNFLPITCYYTQLCFLCVCRSLIF